MRTIFFLFMFLTYILAPSFSFPRHGLAKEQGQDRKSPDLGIEVHNGLISMDIKQAAISDVLHEMARKANIDLMIDQDVKGTISIKLTGVTIEEALEQLCENRAIVFEYLPENKTYRIIRVDAYSKKKEKEITKEDEKAQGGRQRSAKLYDSKGRLRYKPGELLVRFKKGGTEEQINGLHSALGSKVIGTMHHLRLQKIRLRKGLSEQEAIARYAASGITEMVERHALRHPNSTIPNDPGFSTQWALNKIHASEAWDTTQGSPQIVIAVIDSGVDYYHPDLSSNIWTNMAELNGTENVDDDGNGYTDDIYGWDFAGTYKDDPNDDDQNPIDVDGHGTHVAGIIAAVGNNGLGISGVCWKAKLMVLKVQANNSDRDMETWDIIKAIDYAILNGARIVNCSFGGPDDSVEEKAAFGRLKEEGILTVCAAGNEKEDSDEIPT